MYISRIVNQFKLQNNLQNELFYAVWLNGWLDSSSWHSSSLLPPHSRAATATPSSTVIQFVSPSIVCPSFSACTPQYRYCYGFRRHYSFPALSAPQQPHSTSTPPQRALLMSHPIWSTNKILWFVYYNLNAFLRACCDWMMNKLKFIISVQ